MAVHATLNAFTGMGRLICLGKKSTMIKRLYRKEALIYTITFSFTVLLSN